MSIEFLLTQLTSTQKIVNRLKVQKFNVLIIVIT